jgi:hypothetical protein
MNVRVGGYMDKIECSVLLVVTLLLISAIPAFGETTGDDVLDSCQTAIHAYDSGGGLHFAYGWCTGWVAAAMALTKLHNEWASFTEKKPSLLQFCAPDPDIPVIQAVRVVVKYLKEHPEQLHGDGMGLTVAALKDSFPCK